MWRCGTCIFEGYFYEWFTDKSLANFAIINELYCKACGERLGQVLLKKGTVCTDNARKSTGWENYVQILSGTLVSLAHAPDNDRQDSTLCDLLSLETQSN